MDHLNSQSKCQSKCQSKRRRRSRHRPSCANGAALHLLFVLILMSCAPMALSQNQQPEDGCPGSESTIANAKYDFETWNYYEILGLESPPSSKSSSSRQQNRRQRKSIELRDIKRAFRSQSQLHHPDKRNSTTTTTMEESNARFAKIAEAYEVLKDPSRKPDYDEFLSYCESKIRTESFANKFTSFIQQFSTDPKQVFEEFFFGTDEDHFGEDEASSKPSSRNGDDDDDDDDDGPGGFDQRSYPNYSGTTGQQPSEPVRSYESQEVMYDRLTGQEYVRLLQTDEYAKDRRGCFRYRTIAQEFKSKWDKSRENNVLEPITDVYLLDEGFRCQARPDRMGRDSGSQGGSQFQRGKRQRRGTDSIYPGDLLTHGPDKLLTSVNGRYTAGLSEHCELLITSENSIWNDRGENIVWHSNTYVPQSKCFLAFHQEHPSHLVLVLGTPDRPRQILWYSESVRTENENAHFYTRLDNDGALTVYQLRLIPLDQTPKQQPKWVASIGHWFAIGTPETKAALVWMMTRNWLADVIFKWDYHSVPNYVAISRCISTTSPLGCNRAARRMYQLGRDCMYVGRQILFTLDKLVDKALAMFDSEDDDLLDLLQRRLGQVGAKVEVAGRFILKHVGNIVEDLHSRWHAMRLEREWY